MIQKIESQKQDVTSILEELFTENRGESLALQGGDESDTSFHTPPVDGKAGYSTVIDTIK